MSDPRLRRIAEHPKYKELTRKRTRFAWTLATPMLLAYYGYVAVIAFDKALLGRPIGSGVTSWGIPIGFGLIVLTIALTGIYVVRANGEFDRLTQEILSETSDEGTP